MMSGIVRAGPAVASGGKLALVAYMNSEDEVHERSGLGVREAAFGLALQKKWTLEKLEKESLLCNPAAVPERLTI
jgi:hypothetical protein